MINLILPTRPTTQAYRPAADFNSGETFYAEDGNLYMRSTFGCIRFAPDCMIPESEGSMAAYEHFKRCTSAFLNVNVTFH